MQFLAKLLGDRQEGKEEEEKGPLPFLLVEKIFSQ